MVQYSDTAMTSFTLPETQTVLLLHGPKQPYQVTENQILPRLQNPDEVLVRTEFIGLNPVDWKSPDYGFAIPELPYLAGRELVGTIVKTAGGSRRLRSGQKVIVISTDYRDLRKGAFQQYVVARDFNVVKIPWHLPVEQGSTVGVVFVAAALALGVCMGVDFSDVCDGPNLLDIVRSLDPERLPKDIRQECLEGISREDCAKAGDWLAIWGGSSNSASVTLQLARLAGLRIVTVADAAKHGARLLNSDKLRPDILIDSHDPTRAAEVVRGATEGQLRFGLDTGSRASGASILKALEGSQVGKYQNNSPVSPPATPRGYSAHLVGMAGLPPPVQGSQTLLHSVPIKLFHEVPEIGQRLSIWLENLLYNKLLETPMIIDIENGLDAVNNGLDRMRRHEISGGKLIVKVN